MQIDKYIADQIQEAVSTELETQLDRFVQDYLKYLPKPEYASWGRYLTLEQAMTYAGYTSKNGLKTFLKKYKIEPIKHSRKDVKVDRDEIDRGMTAQRITKYKNNLK